MRMIGSAAFAVLVPLVAHAYELQPTMAVDHVLGANSVQTYYVAQSDGFHVVATMNNLNGDMQTVFRFTAVLADGQQLVMSVPGAVGAKSQEVTFRRDGNHLVIIEPVD